jgi:antitoxin YefM
MYVMMYLYTYPGEFMIRLRPTEDIQPLTAFRANVAAFVEQVRTSGRPLILTHHGRGAAVLLGAADYEQLIDELEVLRDLRSAEAQVDTGEGVPHDEATASLRARMDERLKR